MTLSECCTCKNSRHDQTGSTCLVSSAPIAAIGKIGCSYFEPWKVHMQNFFDPKQGVIKKVDIVGNDQLSLF